MTNIINATRINKITTFLKSLNIKSKRFSEIIRTQDISIIQDEQNPAYDLLSNYCDY